MAEFQPLLAATAEWKPHQIAKAGDIAKLADAATALAETVTRLPLIRSHSTAPET